MPALPLIGPSYPIRNSKAESRRVVNWMSVRIESDTGKGGAVGYLEQVPGLRLLGNFGGECRGLFVARDVLYGVFGSSLKRISSAWGGTTLGAIGSSSGGVGMAANNTQLCAVDGASGYVYDLDAGTLSTITASGWLGSSSVEVIDGYGIFADPGTAQFYISANQDFSTIDPLDFATAEGVTGPIVGFITKFRELLILKTNSGEVWYDSGDSDFAFARNSGANIEVGLAAQATLRKIAGTAIWLGRDDRGMASVFSMPGYSPQRISSHALEKKLSAITDLSGATAWTYWQEGLSFYVLNVPGLDTTWVYELAAGIWHERGEWVDGAWSPWRATTHAQCYGVHVVGDADGNLYQLDPLAHTNGSDLLVRDWISPHSATPALSRRRYGSIQIDGQVGEGLPDGSEARVMLRYSSDGGETWSNWRYLNLGAIGQYKARARATMLGADRDRVWHIRVTDDVAFDPVAIVVDEV